MKRIPVILSGGSGERLWPVSRAAFPKQFADFFEETLFHKTLSRLAKAYDPFVITTNKQKALCERAFRDLRMSFAEKIIIEPCPRNTAAAVALLCKTFPNSLLGIFPSDHWITNEEAFLKTLEQAFAMAEQKKIVCLGIKPTYPATGYGYIETEGKSVVSFKEKPDLTTAEKYFNEGRYFWNAGIYIFSTDVMVKNLEKLWPKGWELINKLSVEDAYAQIPSTSIDYAVMEKTKDLVCLEANQIGWSDLGTWDDLIDQMQKNAVTSKVAKLVELDSTNNFVLTSHKKATCLIGIKDLIVVDTVDGLLISAKGKTTLVKEAVSKMKEKNIPQAVDATKEYRPWGDFQSLEEDLGYKVKKVKVLSGQSISYQSHQKRQEHWVILKGEAEITLDGKIQHLKAGESVCVPSGTKHRIKNCGTLDLELIEVQTGTYFGEDDIVRYEDSYGRT